MTKLFFISFLFFLFNNSIYSDTLTVICNNSPKGNYLGIEHNKEVKGADSLPGGITIVYDTNKTTAKINSH